MQFATAIAADGVGQGYKEVQEISPNLRYVIDELDQICQRDRTEIDLKRKILDDLRHLESVVTNKTVSYTHLSLQSALFCNPSCLRQYVRAALLPGKR